MNALLHSRLAFQAIFGREIGRFIQNKSRLFAALVRPSLWLVAFAAGFHNAFGVSIIPPYETYITYQVYIAPGLFSMVLLFYGMQSSLSMVYDREMGMLRLLLTAPLSRGFILFARLLASALLGVIQVYLFWLLAWLYGVELPEWGLLFAFPALLLSALMLGALGLLLSVTIRQLENFAGTMNFVIFPMFFISSALYPLWKLREANADYLFYASQMNPFTHAVELIRFAIYGEWAIFSSAVVFGCAILFFSLAWLGYDPGRGILRKRGG